MNPLVYSDKVPTVPGWYWRRDQLGAAVVKLPAYDNNGPKVRAVWPLHWEARREEKIAPYPERYKAKSRANVKGWLIEYAGPIPEPQEPETEDEKQAREQIERAEQLAQDLYPE